MLGPAVGNLVNHVIEKHGAERSQARNFMACVKLNPKGHLKYYAIQFGSPQPGDLLLDHKLSAEEQSSLRLTVSDSRLVSVLIFAVMLIKMHFIGFFSLLEESISYQLTR